MIDGGFFEGEIFGIGQAIDFGRANKFGAAAVDHVAEIRELAAAIVEAGDAGWAFAAGDSGGEDNLLPDAHGGDFLADVGDFSGPLPSGNVAKPDGDVRQP